MCSRNWSSCCCPVTGKGTQSILWTRDWWITVAINAIIAVGVAIAVHLLTQESKQIPKEQSSRQSPLSDSSKTNNDGLDTAGKKNSPKMIFSDSEQSKPTHSP